jgi:hypothetical protein
VEEPAIDKQEACFRHCERLSVPWCVWQEGTIASNRRRPAGSNSIPLTTSTPRVRHQPWFVGQALIYVNVWVFTPTP